jgi:long-chain-fatty-acid--CoA ligase ACSBG
MGYYKN